MTSLANLSAGVGAAAILVPILASTTFIPSFMSGILIVAILLAVVVLILSRSIFFLGKEEQLRVDVFTETVVINGPGVKFRHPFTYKSATKIAANMLGTVDFVNVKDSVTGAERVARGPQLLFLGPYEKVLQQGRGVTLSETQYISIENQVTGESSLKLGPTIWFPETPHEERSDVRTAIALQEDEYVRLKDEGTGQRWVEKGKKLLFLQTRWRLEGSVRKAWTLKSFEYVRLLNKVTGKVVVHRGEKMVFPGPDDEMLDGDKLSAIDLRVDEYVKLEDQSTGEVRVVPGPAQVFLGPNEKTCDGGKQKAVQVDEETAVLVRDTSTGQLQLTTKKQLFVPGPHEKIEDVQQLIKLADHEAMTVKEDDTHITISVPDSTSVLPTLSVQDLDRAWRALNPAMAWLSAETLHGAVDADYGIHPSHPLWTGTENIMLSNVPCRCKKDELENFISATAATAGVSPETWTLVLPRGSGGRNRGYAFIKTNNPEEPVSVELVRALWQKIVPTRASQRPLKLLPALEDAGILQFSLVLGSMVSS